MRRPILLTLLTLLSAGLASFVAGCGSDGAGALDTLPPIFTTTSTSTTTTIADTRRKFYEVKSGDNLADIARSFQVPRSEIVRINNLPNDGAIIQIGQVLEIPTDVVLVDDLPSPDPTTTVTTEAP
jgi:LysM repeat protein